jgi:hypothetical protein
MEELEELKVTVAGHVAHLSRNLLSGADLLRAEEEKEKEARVRARLHMDAERAAQLVKFKGNILNYCIRSIFKLFI